MHILHLCSYYAGSTVFKNLFLELKTADIQQVVYVPIRSSNDLNKNYLEGVEIEYDLVLTKLDRLNFLGKVRKLLTRTQRLFDIEEYDVVHAHTLFTDGAIAYELWKKYCTPYVITVRNTDVNIFLKYMLHLRPMVRRILKNAKEVVFINSAYQSEVLTKLSIPQEGKFKVIPNCVDSFWFQDIKPGKTSPEKEIHFLYVGDYSPNKNVSLAISKLKAFALENKHLQIEFRIVGGGTSKGRTTIDSRIQIELQNGIPENLNIVELGRISDKSILRELYRWAHLYIMLSKRETFGLVYVEAMSQATPIICTKGQGIQPYFEDFEVGFSIDLEISTDDFNLKLTRLINEYDSISKSTFQKVKLFTPDRVVQDYLDCYQLKTC